jgi:hypothetical protein
VSAFPRSNAPGIIADRRAGRKHAPGLPGSQHRATLSRGWFGKNQAKFDFFVKGVLPCESCEDLSLQGETIGDFSLAKRSQNPFFLAVAKSPHNLG